MQLFIFGLSLLLLGCSNSSPSTSEPILSPGSPSPPDSPDLLEEETESTPDAPLPACDLPGFASVTSQNTVSADSVLAHAIIPNSLGWTGDAAVISSGGSRKLVVSAKYITDYDLSTAYYYLFSYYTDFTTRSELWVFDLPLSAAIMDSTMASAIVSGPLTTDFDIWIPFFGLPEPRYGFVSMAAGDLTGDGTDEIVTETIWYTRYYSVIDMSSLAATQSLDAVTLGNLSLSTYSAGMGAPSIGDWDSDGVGDLAFGGWYLLEQAGATIGAEILTGPIGGDQTIGDLDLDNAIAWFDAYEPESAIGSQDSAMIPDITGDGASELLVPWVWKERIEVEGDPLYTRGFMLFEGSTVGGFDYEDALALLYVPCGASPLTPRSVGDVTGDGLPDIAILGTGPGNEDDEGAVWVVSRLHTLAPTAPPETLSITSLSDTVFRGLADERLSGALGFDLDQDGINELALLTDKRLYLFFGPVQGAYDLRAADLVISWPPVGSLSAGDVDNDGISDLIAGGEYSVQVYSGAALLQWMP